MCLPLFSIVVDEVKLPFFLEEFLYFQYELTATENSSPKSGCK